MIKFLLCFVLLIPPVSMAWTPSGNIHVGIGYPSGSMNEVTFRKASEIVVRNNPGINFIITPRSGADGVVANNYLIEQPANGYHIGVPSIIATVLTNDLWQKDIKKYQWESLIFPVVLGEISMAIVASNQSPVNNFSELVDLLKKPNRNINIATPGGSGTLVYRYLLSVTRADQNVVSEIKYGNTPQTALAVASNVTEFGITAFPVVVELAKNQRLKVLALTGNSVPGYASTKSIMPNFHLQNGWMLALPPTTPTNIVQWYEREFGKAIQDPEYQKWARDNHIWADTNLVTGQQTRMYFNSLKNRFDSVLKSLNH
jgi:tripartite-type tricarboxylate transporter receptor subunit TctC